MNLIILFISLLPFSLFASIAKIESISQLPCDSPPSTLYFFDVDDTLIDSPFMLGSKAWRKYITEILPDWHDTFSLFVARHYHVDSVEAQTSYIIEKLQAKGYGVFCLTARERMIWYDTPMEDVDALTIAQLQKAEIYLDTKALEKNFPSLTAAQEYYEGVFFADIEPKGGYLIKLFQNSKERPEKVVFIDDKLSQVESVALALNELGIDNDCYWYTATDKKAAQFHPLLASIQLFYLWMTKGQAIISDVAAAELASLSPERTTEYYLQAIIEN